MKNTPGFLLAALGLCLALPLSALAQDTTKTKTKPVPALGDGVIVNVTATIQAINLETREITLKGPLGNVQTITADARIKRLAEFKVGDEVTAVYYSALAAELRPPTEAEKQKPLETHEESTRAPDGSAPAGAGLRSIKAVVTVEALDRPTSSVTLKGPRGNYASVRVKDPALLDSLHLGDTVVVTYTEALALELRRPEPAPAPAEKKTP